MPSHLNGVQATGTITVGASGGATGIAEIYPVRSNAPFTNLGISIIPVEDSSPYTVSVYHDGELIEEHNFPNATDEVVCHMVYPNLIFPANIGTEAIPKFIIANKFNAPGIPIRVVIENGATAARTFYVYATYMECVGPRFEHINQE